MAFHLYGDHRDDTEIAAIADVEHPSQVLTSLERQETLFNDGYQFEAASARAAMLDGIALAYLFLAKEVGKIAFDAKTLQRLKDERLTLEQVKDALIAANAPHDLALVPLFTRFITQRNHLAHHAAIGSGPAAIGSGPVNLAAFFDDGRELALALWRHVCGDLRQMQSTPGIEC